MSNEGHDGFSGDAGEVERDYNLQLASAIRLESCLSEQITTLVNNNVILLGAPLESRIKSWPSIKEKIQRKTLSISSVIDLDDLIGVRAILLFSRDVDRFCKIIEESFVVLSSEDTTDRLSDAQFGYRSKHYIVKLPDNWLDIPSYAGLGGLRAEIQIRTMTQHIWAVASHHLQYKREHSVPIPLRRAIYRVSALLETIDLEFDRVLSERSSYTEDSETTSENSNLDVDNLKIVMNENLPEKNKSELEDYDDLLEDLRELSIVKISDLRKLLSEHMSAAMERERENVLSGSSEDPERVARGVYFTQSGLVRCTLVDKFGPKKAYATFSRRVKTA